MRLPFFALSLALLSVAAFPAHAKLEICNKTPSPFSVAVAYETDSDIISQGWWTVDPDKCETVIQGDLNRKYYYHYIKSRALNLEWAGSFNFCTNLDPQFRVSGSGNCEDRNLVVTGFRQVDVGTNKDFALDITMGPSPSTDNTAPAPDAAATTPPAATPPAATPAPAAPAPAAPAQPEAAE